MKYALLLYSSPEARDRHLDGGDAIVAEYAEIFRLPGVVDGLRLQEPDSATTVRVEENGEALLSDGPFVDAKEYLGGLYLIEADNLDAATAIAQKIPTARLGGAVEVRPINEQPLR
ncbi:MAG: hypothetical protein C5B48_14630 [Candidatus Rokuibacteriota bacterium]|nr:MAG: hypothetical protein C5B48_14630 [Candidatus Rokubacteria bacterium]